MSTMKPADVMIPRIDDFEKWAVVACDQFSSEPEYWQEAEKIVGDAPSALRLILPEAELGGDVSARVQGIQAAMKRYIEEGLFETYPKAYVYVERTMKSGKIRKGVVGMVDLDAYDYMPASGAAIRATEKTVVERIPPRMKIRQGAPVELPHVILLCDDPEKTVVEPLAEKKGGMKKLYDFDLMLGGGHIAGWLVEGEDAKALDAALDAYEKAAPARYARLKGTPMVFAAGDGNHSLATAKACYEALKQANPGEDLSDHPARYALVELENIHDEALEFEPIHRIVTGVDVKKLLDAVEGVCAEGGYPVKWISGEESGTVYLDRARSPLAVGVLQPVLDAYLAENGGGIDYIHGEDVLERLAKQENAVGFFLPPMGKDQLFAGVIADGMLPRKTFSMGHAQEKRYYLEAREIEK